MLAMTSSADPAPGPLGVPGHLFTAIDHVGMAVPDLDEAIAFYRDTFGMRLHEYFHTIEWMSIGGSAQDLSPC